ncbi:MAG: MBL fold metallo-hydrolase, partial [Campylobacterales bacterium]
MEILVRQFSGEYQTNCYIIDRKLIIDPGEGAFRWISKVCQKPVAILNTHGHFDHIWDNRALQEKLQIPIYIHREDQFWFETPQFGFYPPPPLQWTPIGEGVLEVGGYQIFVHHFPGHTPGSVAFEIGEALFSGDFIFAGSIGRVDFPFSDPSQMVQSLRKFLHFPKNLRLYPGHG